MARCCRAPAALVTRPGAKAERSLVHRRRASGLLALWLDIKITQGTNTKAETTAFVKAAFAGMEAILGKLHRECYVFVHAVDGDAYGYGGRTQNGRWAASHPG